MKRKFISAMLFGALLIAPATTFVGCADYDDDIENLQGQITNNATTLDQLTKEKIQNVETEIESLKAANKQLQEALDKAKSEGTDADAATLAAAQKLVEDAQAQLQAALDAVNGDITGINGKISDLDARLLAQDGRLKSVESLLAADGKLTLAINDAQALAEKAYNLAEQTAATAEANKQAIKDAADNLKSIKESLEGQINTLSDKVNDLSKKLADQNADITAQINSLKSQLNDANEGISANGDKIKANKQKIDEIVGQLTELQNQINANKSKVETLESNYLSKVNELVAGQNGLKTSIDGLKSANETINQRLESAEGRLDTIDDLIASLAKSSDVTSSIDQLRQEIDAKIGKLNEEGKNESVATLIAGINTSITTINGNIERIDGEITKINGLIDVLFTDLSNLITGLIVQDYSDFNAVYAQVAKYNVTPNDGKTYYVNNATEQEAYFPYKRAEGRDQRHINNYTVQQYCGDVYATINPNTVSFEGQTLDLLNSQDGANPEYKLTKAVVSNKLITRAAAKNGLYKFSVYNENQNVGFVPEHVGDGKDAVYALAATNQGLKGKDNKDIEGRRVYSKYELKFKPTNITSYNRAVLSVRPISAGTLQPEAIEPGVDKFCFEKLTGCQFKLVANQKVYAKYIECVGAKSASGQPDDLDEITNMNKNAGFKTTLKETSINKVPSGASVSINELFNTITINNAKNGYTYTYDYYTWDYNGAITKHQFKVIYTEAMYNENAISYEHTPASASDQTTPGTNTAFSHTLSMTSKNNVWKDNVKTIQVVGSDIPNMTVYFNKANGAVVKTLNVLNGSSAKTTTLTTSELNNIKNLSFKYNPTNVAPGDYKFTVKFYDRNGNVVTSVDVKVTIKVPTTLADKIERIHRVFAGDDVILYAANNGTNAYANMSSAFVNVGQNLTASSGTGRIFFADALSNYPTTPTNENTQYKPVIANNATCYTHKGNIFFDNQFVVPYVSVKNEHVYNLTVGAKYYGLNDYWTPQAKEGTTFNVKVVSPIYHAINFEQRPIELSYPQVLTLGDNVFSATNPADHSQTIKYLGTNRDALIASTKIEVSAADNILEVTSTANNSFELKLKGTAGVADGQDFKLNFVVTDVFGKEKSYPITVTFKKNTRPEIKHHR